eukprot:CAMPEP_0118929220 /NCGR_PEP_ID=MMETSP1169-20130426/6276_1 /TAXON_ID=36882 /ORGANISM="Pyramimonas obovata, Strain CCMP722" /LENGTH=159 /DNA_ID=CAMNT_0006871371 /DNA_START=188 /DNA_END=668 /DNA_ORIENTATION=-
MPVATRISVQSITDSQGETAGDTAEASTRQTQCYTTSSSTELPDMPVATWISVQSITNSQGGTAGITATLASPPPPQRRRARLQGRRWSGNEDFDAQLLTMFTKYYVLNRVNPPGPGAGTRESGRHEAMRAAKFMWHATVTLDFEYIRLRRDAVEDNYV